VSKRSVEEIHGFFKTEYNIAPHFLIPNLHLTVYHSRRPMPLLQEQVKSCHMVVDTLDTRFMVLSPGGENPRTNLIPGEQKVGIRIKRTADLREKIDVYRRVFFEHETARVLGSRNPSSRSKNAFGARHFQPHISILQSGSNIVSDLSIVGDNFRDAIAEIHFDKFIIQTRKNF